MLRYKDGVVVNPGPLDPLIRTMENVSEVYGDIWVTSGNDGTHAPRSYHKIDRAVDIRSKGRTFSDLRELLAAIWIACPPGYKIMMRIELDKDKEKHYWWHPGQPFPVPSKGDLWDERHVHIQVIS